MKKIVKIAFCVILMIFIFVLGCAKQYVCTDGTTVNDAVQCKTETPQVSEETNNIPSEQTQETKSAEIPKESVKETQQEAKPQLELTQAQKDILKEMLMTQKTAIFPQMLGINDQVPVGGAYTYAFGIKNTNVKPATFKYTIQLLESKTVSLSNGGADDTVLSLFSKYTDTNKQYTLGKNEIAYIPLIVSIGEKANNEGKLTFAGTYKFRLKTETVEEPFTHDYHFFDFTLIVK